MTTAFTFAISATTAAEAQLGGLFKSDNPAKNEWKACAAKMAGGKINATAGAAGQLVFGGCIWDALPPVHRMVRLSLVAKTGLDLSINSLHKSAAAVAVFDEKAQEIATRLAKQYQTDNGFEVISIDNDGQVTSLEEEDVEQFLDDAKYLEELYKSKEIRKQLNENPELQTIRDEAYKLTIVGKNMWNLSILGAAYTLAGGVDMAKNISKAPNVLNQVGNGAVLAAYSKFFFDNAASTIKMKSNLDKTDKRLRKSYSSKKQAKAILAEAEGDIATMMAEADGTASTVDPSVDLFG